LAGLLALTGVLGIGEGHLFHHRKARRLVSGDFAKSGSLFQDFPSCATTAMAGSILSPLQRPRPEQLKSLAPPFAVACLTTHAYSLPERANC
ncbi:MULTISPECIES: hypothetical protein, partial [Pseudomonas]